MCLERRALSEGRLPRLRLRHSMQLSADAVGARSRRATSGGRGKRGLERAACAMFRAQVRAPGACGGPSFVPVSTATFGKCGPVSAAPAASSAQGGERDTLRQSIVSRSSLAWGFDTTLRAQISRVFDSRPPAVSL